jgi:hypothetical protein
VGFKRIPANHRPFTVGVGSATNPTWFMPPPFQGGGIKKLWKACQPRASPARSMSAVRRGSLIVERRDGHLNQSDLPAYVRRKSKIMSLYHKCPKCGVFGVPGEHKCDQERTSNTQSSTQSQTQSSSSASASTSSDGDGSGSSSSSEWRESYKAKPVESVWSE